jgi:hypothetical protein
MSGLRVDGEHLFALIHQVRRICVASQGDFAARATPAVGDEAVFLPPLKPGNYPIPD